MMTVTMDVVERAVMRSQVNRSILTCTQCPLHLSGGPVSFSGPTPSRVMAVGIGPNGRDLEARRPFSGGSGRFLWKVAGECGLRMDEWFLTNAVACDPSHEEKPGPYIRSCANIHLRAQIKLADPEWILILGATAVDALGVGKVQVRKHHGRVFRSEWGMAKGRWCFVAYHPAMVLRDGGFSDEGKSEAAFRDDLTTFRRVLAGEADPTAITLTFGRGGKVLG